MKVTQFIGDPGDWQRSVTPGQVLMQGVKPMLRPVSRRNTNALLYVVRESAIKRLKWAVRSKRHLN